MKIIGVIPARYKSSRFPGKPLVDICGKPMIWWVYQQAKKVKRFEEVVVATDDKKIDALGIFDYNTKFINSSTFDNASTDRIVGQIYASSNLIKEKIIGFQNRCDLNFNIKTPLFEIEEKYSNDLTNKQEGFYYKNVYATHIIGPLLIRNPYFTDYLLKKLCKSKNIEYKISDKDSIKAYKKYLSNFY